jgi:hypothetical protein
LRISVSVTKAWAISTAWITTFAIIVIHSTQLSIPAFIYPIVKLANTAPKISLQQALSVSPATMDSFFNLEFAALVVLAATSVRVQLNVAPAKPQNILWWQVSATAIINLITLQLQMEAAHYACCQAAQFAFPSLTVKSVIRVSISIRLPNSVSPPSAEMESSKVYSSAILAILSVLWAVVHCVSLITFTIALGSPASAPMTHDST